MPKDSTPKLLAKSPLEWKEIERLVRDHVETICYKYDDKAQAEAFVTLIGLCTSEQYESSDREIIADVILRHAFSFTAAFDKAINLCLKRAA